MFQIVVLIVSLNSNCSGFVLTDGFVVTASHCPKDGVTANGVEATFVKADTELDVMLLKANVRGKAKFAYAQLGEEVSVLGYSGDIKMLTKGHVASLQGDYILLDITVFKGESGSAVFNKRGEVVGMVVGGVSDGHMNLVVALSSAKIRGFVK